MLNLARGTDLSGLSSLHEIRKLNNKIQLVRPLLGFSRKETKQICQEMNLPIWIDPSNQNLNLNRNRIRKEVIPLLEEMHPGSSRRIASLAERLTHIKDNQDCLTSLVIKAINTDKGLCRQKLWEVPTETRNTIFSKWFQEEGLPSVSTSQLEDLSISSGEKMPPGIRDFSKGWKVKWNKEYKADKLNK